MRRKSIFNSRITIGSYQGFINAIFLLVENKTPSYVCFANVHMVIEAHRDKEFQIIVNGANLVAPDGKPLSVFLQLFKRIKQERVCGMDLLPDLLRTAESLKKSVYFYGTTDELLQDIINKARKDFPALQIAGYYSPPFKNTLSEEESVSIIQRIKTASPHLVFVSLGCPKQEMWMAKNRDAIGACLLGVGQAFRVYAGHEKRLPAWMRNLSLEWMYRLYLEPGRLWKRYMYTNFYFLFLTFKYMVKGAFQNMYFLFVRKRKFPVSR